MVQSPWHFNHRHLLSQPSKTNKALPCIINLDDFGNMGSHWVYCWMGDREIQYFDSFGIPPPEEWLKKSHVGPYVYNQQQIQAIPSVRCGYYCLFFLNGKNKGTSFEDIMNIFSRDVKRNETFVKEYFSH